jgi:hypothetical protein
VVSAEGHAKGTRHLTEGWASPKVRDTAETAAFRADRIEDPANNPSQEATMVRAAWLLIAATLSSMLLVADPIEGQQRPRYGGELVFLVPSEPPSYDGHREGTFGTVHVLAPHYSTLLRMDPVDRTGTRPVPDLAESWTISPDAIYCDQARSSASPTGVTPVKSPTRSVPT